MGGTSNTGGSEGREAQKGDGMGAIRRMGGKEIYSEDSRLGRKTQSGRVRPEEAHPWKHIPKKKRNQKVTINIGAK